MREIIEAIISLGVLFWSLVELGFVLAGEVFALVGTFIAGIWSCFILLIVLGIMACCCGLPLLVVL